MLTLTIKITGFQEGDLDLSLQEVNRLIAQGYTSGLNSNDTESYEFFTSGEEESPPVDDEDSDHQ